MRQRPKMNDVVMVEGYPDPIRCIVREVAAVRFSGLMSR